MYLLWEYSSRSIFGRLTMSKHLLELDTYLFVIALWIKVELPLTNSSSPHAHPFMSQVRWRLK